MNKIVVRASFDTVIEQLKTELEKTGFQLSGVTDFQQAFSDKLNIHFKKHKIFAVYIPHLYQEMLMFECSEGIVVPCNVTLIERYPGEVVIIVFNPTESIVRDIQNPTMENIAHEVSRRLEFLVQSLERESNTNFNLVTSWG